jgi:hypothetical protein
MNSNLLCNKTKHVNIFQIYLFKHKYNVFKYNEIYHAIYNYEWYSVDPKEAKDLILFMIKVSEPVHLTAGKIFPITMATFCNV